MSTFTENKNARYLVNKNVIKWVFSYWPCYRSSDSCIVPRLAVLALGVASGQYSQPRAYTTVLGPVTRPIWKHPFNNIITQIFKDCINHCCDIIDSEQQITFKIHKIHSISCIETFVECVSCLSDVNYAIILKQKQFCQYFYYIKIKLVDIAQYNNK